MIPAGFQPVDRLELNQPFDVSHAGHAHAPLREVRHMPKMGIFGSDVNGTY
jgi:hypothetical protein